LEAYRWRPERARRNCELTSTRRRTREDTENTEETISSRKHDEPAAHLYVAAASPPGRVYVGPSQELSTMRTSSLQNRPVHRHHSKRAFKVQFIGGGAHSGAGEYSAYGESRVLGQRPRNSDTFEPSTEGAIQRCIGLAGGSCRQIRKPRSNFVCRRSPIG
jgi:hypothetical protein